MLRSYLKIAFRENRAFSVVYIAVLCIGITACNRSVLNSALTVQPGKQFRLGGNQKGAFTVQVKNVGNVPVTISERRVDGQEVTLGTFRPGDGQTVRFSAGSAALVDNASKQSAQLNLVVTGDKDGLSMGEVNKQ
ncbi:hypothetical protein ACFSUS_10465 [Spirosoma soli]|uniref:DUF1573 domain-containing protein n=1 Tax=Spirosoma soli TaxID=1770529 RepID=A0ABW5M1Y7_9BACT